MKRLFACLLLLLCTLAHAQFDHSHAAWNDLLKKHVQWLPDNRQSRVDYASFQRDRAPLRAVLDAMGAVPKASFDAWPREQRMAFLINAYNAFTVELILTKYPDLKSIKDITLIGSLADRTRNRVRNGQLEVSAIFKWFKEDFEHGHQGFAQVEDVFAKYAAQLSDKPEEQAKLRNKVLPVMHLDYDWSLNATGR